MSETDGFIEEVTEEVQRDKLFATMRKYGWIAILVVIVLVGGTAYNEFRKSNIQSQAEDLGDALLDALETDDDEDRAAALEELAEADDANLVAKLLAADGPEENSLAMLRSIAEDGDQPARFRDLAALKLAVLSTDAPVDERIALLEPLAGPDALYRAVAIEYLVAAHLEAGDNGAAIALLQGHIEREGTSPQQAQRMTEILVALGVTPELESSADSAN